MLSILGTTKKKILYSSLILLTVKNRIDSVEKYFEYK